MTTTDELRELIARLELANKDLKKLARDRQAYGMTGEALRLRGKAEGVRLAKSYAEDMLRQREQSEEEGETYSVAQIRGAFAKHASPDDWGVRSFYENSLISALRGEFEDAAPGGEDS